MRRLLPTVVIALLSASVTGCLVRPTIPPAATQPSEVARVPLTGTAPEAPRSAGAGAAVRFTATVPVEVGLGDDNGAPVGGHVSAEQDGVPVTQFGYSPGRGVVLKGYSVGGLEGANELRVYAPLEACRHLKQDRLHVVATAPDGSTAETDLPVRIVRRGVSDPTPDAAGPPVAPSGGSERGAGVAVAITSPAAGARLSGVVHQVSGTASGLEQVTVMVSSATGEYNQGTTPVVDGRWTLPVYLGDSDGNGTGEGFRIFATATDRGVQSNRIRVIRIR